ncbi:MAG: hypothetical protein ACK4Z5_03515 [Brevundimonas sp.]
MQNPFRNRSEDDQNRDWNDDRRMSPERDDGRDREHRSWQDQDRARGGGVHPAMSGGRQGDWGSAGYGQAAQGSQLYGGPGQGGGIQGQSDYGGYSGYGGPSAGGGAPRSQGDDATRHGRFDQGHGETGYGRGGYGQSGAHAGSAGADYGYGRQSHAPGSQIWGQEDHRSIRQGSGGTYGQGGHDPHHGAHHEFEPDYLQWREAQMRSFDDDYRSWRDERRQKFSSDFDTWRSSRNGDAARNNLSASAVQDVADGGKGQSDLNDAARDGGTDATHDKTR